MCCTCCRILLMALNVAMLLAGLALLGVVLWIKLDGNSMPTIRSNIEFIAEKAAQHGGEEIVTKINLALTIAFWVLIAVSAACVILALLGACGAGCRSSCVLGFYASLLILLVVLEVSFCILIIVYRPKVKDEVETYARRVDENCKRYGADYDCPAVQSTWDAIDDGLLIAGIAALVLVIIQVLAIVCAFIAACCKCM